MLNEVLTIALQTLLAEQHILRSLPNKNKLMQNEAQLHEVAEQLRHSTAQLCRNLKVSSLVT